MAEYSEYFFYLLTNDSINIIIIFSTTDNFKFVCKTITIYVDETFKSCFKMFTQMFIIIVHITTIILS